MEARDRIGGRIHTLADQSQKWPVELGAHFVHGKQNETWKIIREAGLETQQVPDRHWETCNGKLTENSSFLEDLAKVTDKVDTSSVDQSFQSYLDACADLDASWEALPRFVLYGDPVGAGFLTFPKSPRVQTGDWSRPSQVLADVVRAVEMLDDHAIPGPYEAILSSARYYAYLQATTEAGYPASRHVKEVLAAVHRSPVMRDAGAVFSTRGGDFVITVGGDLATGYRWHDRESIHLFCAETIAAQTMTPEAVCLLG